MPDDECRTDRATGIARRRLHVDLLNGVIASHLAIGDRVHGAAAGDRHGIQPMTRMQRIQQMEKGLLIHRLHRAGDVPVPLCPAARPSRAPARADPPAPGRTASRPPASRPPTRIRSSPCDGGSSRASSRNEPSSCSLHDPAHLVQIPRLAVRREPHHLVFVAVMRKAEILRQRLVKDAERMRKIDPILHLDSGPATDAPRGAGEIAEAVHRHDHRLLERRDMKRRGQMRQMVLHRVHLAAKRWSGNACAKCSAIPARSRLLRMRSSTSPRSGRCASV